MMVPVRYITIKKHAEETGYSVDAIRQKIRTGVWLQGSVWIKAPDGRQLIDVEGYNQWAESAKGCDQHRRRASKSGSSTAACVATNT